MNDLPKGWNEDRVKTVIEHYEYQNEDDAVDEDEAAFKYENSTYFEIPAKLVPKVRELLLQNEKN